MLHTLCVNLRIVKVMPSAKHSRVWYAYEKKNVTMIHNNELCNETAAEVTPEEVNTHQARRKR